MKTPIEAMVGEGEGMAGVEEGLSGEDTGVIGEYTAMIGEKILSHTPTKAPFGGEAV